MYRYRRLKDLREDSDKTQREIGLLLGTTQQQYAKYEAGLQEMPAHHLLTLAGFYGVSLDYLLGRVDNDTEQLIQKIMGMSEEQRDRLLEAAKEADE